MPAIENPPGSGFPQRNAANTSDGLARLYIAVPGSDPIPFVCNAPPDLLSIPQIRILDHRFRHAIQIDQQDSIRPRLSPEQLHPKLNDPHGGSDAAHLTDPRGVRNRCIDAAHRESGCRALINMSEFNPQRHLNNPWPAIDVLRRGRQFAELSGVHASVADSNAKIGVVGDVKKIRLIAKH
jgi:hypothetical protein